MTQSAPMDRTMSKFVVLHTPVTFAANDFAICTANVPTPPAAPLIKTFCPCRIRPLSRRPCSAVSAATGADAAWSNVTLDQAASAPGAALTALQGLRDKGRIRSEE